MRAISMRKAVDRDWTILVCNVQRVTQAQGAGASTSYLEMRFVAYSTMEIF
jgi:hypothetical protein